jgi:hypothetical protein
LQSIEQTIINILLDLEDFVDNNTSNVDSSVDKGTHSNFTAQHYGPDSIYDILTEENTRGEGISVTINNITTFADDAQSFSFSHTSTGSNRLLIVSVHCDNGDRDVTTVSYGGTNLNHLTTIIHSGGKPRIEVWYLTAPDTGSNTVSVSLAGGADKCAIGAISYNGVNQTTPIQGTTTTQGYSTSPSVTVSTATGDLVQDAMASISDGSPSVGSGQTQIYNIETEMGGPGVSSHYGAASTEEGDTSVIMSWTLSESKEWVIVGLSIVGAEQVNNELDLEVQWTNVDYNQPNEELCIYGGTMGIEDISVDVWNGVSWQNVFTDLTIGWNNVTVSTYLTSSTFTIRFKGASETSDPTQDFWNIDATLLHVWS